ncbi:MFS transporter [Sphingomonas cavernae]|uniref:MFS transporter n=1 Tax=Sphingomonas cavernae TaxID=2320861 RepID=A0A418W6M0_9SPHN|nr:MFS transporter [Sphingomonas cavernae]RJF85577.1 MFS transporter [Sphingomonas cavernae]
MKTSLRLLARRRFLPLFVTQLLGAFNDNLFKQAMILFVTYQVYSDPLQEQWFNAVATGLFILPFFLLSALSGQLADARDKAQIIRWVKTAEIFIMVVGAAGLLLPSVPLMLVAVLAMGVHSTFFGPIKYAILPQHLQADEVLGGTGLVEAGTYIAILAGTIAAGALGYFAHYTGPATGGLIGGTGEVAAVLVLAIAILGWLSGRQVPSAPPIGDRHPIDLNVFSSSWRLISNTMHIPRLFLAICSISFFWTIGSVLFIEFPPIVKNVLTADEGVTSLLLSIFSVGVAIGSIAINRLLKGHVSAKFAPISVIAMGGFVIAFWFSVRGWHGLPDGRLYDFWSFVSLPGAPFLLGSLLFVAISGGMFVVPLYAFLTTTVDKSETARTVAANNIVNSGAMVIGAAFAMGLSAAGVSAVDQLLMVAAMCLVSAWLAQKLHLACD